MAGVLYFHKQCVCMLLQGCLIVIASVSEIAGKQIMVFGLRHLISLREPDVLKEHIASVFRVKE